MSNPVLRLSALALAAGSLGAAPPPGAADPAAMLGQPMQIALLLAALSLLPAVIMSVTPFLRITLVLHFLRQALGTQTAPSNQVLLGLALFLTAVVTQPLTGQLNEQSWAPYRAGSKTLEQAAADGAPPLRAYLLPSSRATSRASATSFPPCLCAPESGRRNDNDLKRPPTLRVASRNLRRL